MGPTGGTRRFATCPALPGREVGLWPMADSADVLDAIVVHTGRGRLLGRVAVEPQQDRQRLKRNMELGALTGPQLQHGSHALATHTTKHTISSTTVPT